MQEVEQQEGPLGPGYKVGLWVLGSMYLGVAALSALVEAGASSSRNSAFATGMAEGYFASSAGMPALLATFVSAVRARLGKKMGTTKLFLQSLFWVLLAAFPFQSSALLLKALTSVGPLVAASQGATTFVSDEGRFRVDMPGPAKHTEHILDADADPRLLHMFSANDGDVAFSVAYTDVAIAGRTAGEILAGGRDNLLSKPGRTLIGEWTVSSGAHLGSELEFETAGIFHCLRMFLIDARVYQVHAAGAEELVKARREPFFESFEILDADTM